MEDASADSIEFADGDDDDDQEFDYEEGGQGEEEGGDEEGDEEREEEGDDAAEYNAEDETDFSSQDFDAEPDDDNEKDVNQVDVNVNMNIVETIVLDTLDKNTNNNNNDNNNQQNNKNIKNAQQQPVVVNNNDTNDDVNIDNKQDNQNTKIDTTDDAVSTTAAAEKCKLPPTVDDIVCTGVPPTGEEATHIDVPLKSVDFSPLVKTVKGFTYRWEYSGSLTTPPSSEHVAWNVMHEPFPIGLEQLRALVDLQGYNARMINEDPQSKREPVA